MDGKKTSKTLQRVEEILERSKRLSRRPGKTTNNPKRKKENPKEGRKKVKYYRNQRQVGGRGSRPRTQQIRQRRGGTRRKLRRRQGVTQNRRMGSSKNRRIRTSPNHVKQFVGTLQNFRRSQNISINRRIGFDSPMPFLEPKSRNFGDGCILTGSEYLGSVEIRTTKALGIKTTPGDFIKFQPVAPNYFPGTRLMNIAKMFQHYKYRHIVFEFVPIVPAIQDGALLMLCSYDVDENFSLEPDPDTRLRMAMAHRGAQMFNVIDYGRCALTQSQDTQKFYYTGQAEEARLENQGSFIFMAASTFTPYDGESEVLTLGQVIIHYEAEFTTRNLYNNEIVEAPVQLDSSAQFQLTFATNGSGSPVELVDSLFTTKDSEIYIISSLSNCTENTTNLDVQLPNIEVPVNLFSKGSIWFGASASNGGGLIIFGTLEGALEKEENQAAKFLGTVVGTNIVELNIIITPYDMNLFL